MPQSAADRILGPPTREAAERIEPQTAPAGPTAAERLFGSGPEALRPPGMAGPMTGPQPAEFDFPEITQVGERGKPLPGTTMTQTIALASGLLFATDPAQQADILKANIPGVELDNDRNGNLFARIPGLDTPVYINRPGPSPQDFTQMAAFAAPAIRFGQAGAALGQSALGPLIGQGAGRVVGTAGGEAALSRITDVALQGAGSQQPASTPRALAAAAFGATGEALIPPLVGILTSAGRRGIQPFRTTPTGQVSLTAEARRLIEQAGLDPNTLSQDLIAELNRQVNAGAVPAQAQRVAEAASLPVPVPLTRGNVTRAPSDQMFEDLASKGSFGRVVESVVQNVRQQQQVALRGNVEAIQGQIAGGQAQVLARGEGGPLVSDAINAIKDNADRIVDRAYDAARNAGRAGLPNDAMQRLAFNLESTIADRIEFSPRGQSLLTQLRDLGTQAGDGQVTVDALFNWRRRLTTLANETTDLTDKAAMNSMRRTFDAQMVEIVEQGLLQGDDAAVGLWLNAIRRRREFGQIFEAANRESPNYLVDLLTETIDGGEGGRILRVEPDQAMNAIFGATNTGFINNRNIARQLTQLESVLTRGGRRDAWNALREEAFLRFAGQSEGPFIGSTNTRSFSGANFARAIDTAMERNRPAMMALFAPEELALLAQLERTALATTTVTAGGANFSNTAIAQSQLFRSTLGRFIGRVFGPVLQSASETVPLGNVFQLVRANRAVQGGAQRVPGLPAGVGGGIGATVGPDVSRETREGIGRLTN